MEEKKRNPFSYGLFRVIRWLIKLFYPKIKVVGAENLPQDGALIVGNHSKMNGPICAELYFPGKCTTWCTHKMMEVKEVPAYAFEDFWSSKPRWSQWFYHGMSYVIAPLSACIFNNAKTIPVYRDNRLIKTFRQTISALQEDTKVVIFPECYEPYNNIIYQFQEHYIDVAKLYYKRTGKCLSFVPLYIAPNLKTMYIGKSIAFDPENPMEEERRRINTYLMEQITAIARALPRHTVIPYPNMPKKNYPTNIPQEDQTNA